MTSRWGVRNTSSIFFVYWNIRKQSRRRAADIAIERDLPELRKALFRPTMRVCFAREVFQPDWFSQLMDASHFQSLLQSTAGKLARHLIDTGRDMLVLAESCTAGLAAASLVATPGISQHLCGSFVTYRDSTKLAWLGVSPPDFAQHGAVSAPVSEQMAMGALERTPEANWSAAVTGHLGPNAPLDFDGLIFVSIVQRQALGAFRTETESQRFDATTRVDRQYEAAAFLLDKLLLHFCRYSAEPCSGLQ